jgi:hypothetical protein
LLDDFGHFTLKIGFLGLFLSDFVEFAFLYLVIFLQLCQSDVIFLERGVKQSGCQIETFFKVSAVLLCLEFCRFVELIAQLEEPLGETVNGV